MGLNKLDEIQDSFALLNVIYCQILEHQVVLTNKRRYSVLKN